MSVLEHLLTSEAPVQDRMFAGHCLLCVYGRLKFGDSQCIEEEPEEDDEYVECGMTMHKTSHLVGRARRVLPVVAPSVGSQAQSGGSPSLRGNPCMANIAIFPISHHERRVEPWKVKYY